MALDGSYVPFFVFFRLFVWSNIMKPLKYLLLCSIFISCATERIVSYDEAYKNCVVDTIQVQGAQGPMDVYMRRYQGLIGAQLPEFSGKCINGKEINTAYFEGNISIINFWFIGCQPCEVEIPFINQMVDKYKASDINFLAIGLNAAADIEEFVLTKPFNFDHFQSGKFIIDEKFRIDWGYPTTFIVNREMKIVHITNGLGGNAKASKNQRQFMRQIEKSIKPDNS
ncbi:MAG: TlpA disulfide reductase family protein [Saprospiraceae bacterium]|nr:TlpA disulfide reductase family protein [Saprospiraceae bacterium]